ncbi:MAG: DUF357 domain-containing protein [Methanomicrobiales archaeon]|nr:DUF357 domain-containing protein [Methanomicrobiales archaeon]
MTLDRFGQAFREALAMVSIPVPEGSSLYAAATSVLEMAEAYADDGHTFLAGGDAVNALASFAYGLGWLDAGAAFGLFEGVSGGQFNPDYSDSVPGDRAGHLLEKTQRYRRMLAEAYRSVDCAPDPESPPYTGCKLVLGTVLQACREGDACRADHDHEDALAWYSYGYGWLDAGVRCGLLRIEQNRSLFTI